MKKWIDKIKIVTFVNIILLIWIKSIFCSDFNSGFKIVVDTEGRKVKIPYKVKRVIVLTGTSIETIYIIGSLNKVVGLSKNIADSPFISKLIKDLKKIPVVAQDLKNVDVEKIAALKPDLLIGIGPEHPFGMSSELVKKIESLGIPVVLLNLDSLRENYYSIELIGKIFNKEDEAKELINYMKKVEKEITTKVSKIPYHKRVKVLMLSQKPNMVLGGYWGKEDIIVLAGGINVASEIKNFVAEVPLEKIVKWNPEIITIVGSAPYEPEDIINNPQWRNIKAVKEGKVYKYPLQITGLFTPRVTLLLAWHASKFYPELNIDWQRYADEFFKKFYGVSYNQLQKLVKGGK